MPSTFDKNYLRSSIFGFEDALVSTTGVVAGISVGVADKNIVLLASLVTIAVEALSMGVGQFFSEQTLHEIEKTPKHRDNLVVGSLIMFASYAFGGLIPVIPVLLLPFPGAVVGSLLFALVGLFLLGYIKGKLVKELDPVRGALQMLLIGGLATLVGVLAGFILRV